MPNDLFLEESSAATKSEGGLSWKPFQIARDRFGWAPLGELSPSQLPATQPRPADKSRELEDTLVHFHAGQ